MADKLLVTYWRQGSTQAEAEKEFENTSSDVLGAMLDVYDYVKDGGSCLLQYGNRACLVRTVGELHDFFGVKGDK